MIVQPRYILLIGIFSLTLTSSTINAEDESIGAIFLNEAVGTRPAAMGEAFVGIAGGVNTLFWNPAGLVRSNRVELLVSHTEFIQDFRNEYFALGTPVSSRDSLGINGYFSYSQLEKTTSLISEPSSFNVYDCYLSLVWSHAWDKFYSTGVSLKGITQMIDTYSAWSIAVDLSLLMQETLLPELTIGLVIKNLGMPIKFIAKEHPLPMVAEIGAGYYLFDKKLLLSFDISKPLQQELLFKFGVEYNIEEVIRIRAGYKYYQFGNDLGALSGLTCGLGAEISDYQVGYTYTPYTDLGNVHRVSITFPFERSAVEEEKIIQRLEKKIKVRQKKIIRDYVTKGNNLFKKGKYSKAISYYEKALALNPRYPYLKKKISQSKKRLKNIKAEKHFQKGLHAYKQKEYITALIEWNKVYEIMPSYKNIKSRIKQVNHELTRVKKSKSAKKKGKNFDRYFSQGLEYLQMGQYRKAINTWQKLLTLDPQNSRVKRYLKKTKTKMLEETRELLKQANMHWLEKDFAAAVKLWRKVLKIDPENLSARQALKSNQSTIHNAAEQLYRVGIQNYVKNKLGEAIENWKNVLILDPRHQKAAKNLKRAQEKLKDIESFE